MEKIKLTQGKVTKVSNEDYQELSAHKWYAGFRKNTGTWYAMRVEKRGNERVTVLMQDQIMHPSPDKEVHHKDGDTLNNQRGNLVVVTHSFNQLNRAEDV
jgi:hypothetical protein